MDDEDDSLVFVDSLLAGVQRLIAATERALAARKALQTLDESVAGVPLPANEATLLRQCVAVQSCAHGLLEDAESETLGAGRAFVDSLQTALQDARRALTDDARTMTQLDRDTLNALLVFFDRWSGAQVESWSGLAGVDEEATDLRAQLTKKKTKL